MEPKLMVLICSLIDFGSLHSVCLRSVESALFNSDLRDSVLMNSFVSGRMEFGRGVWLKNGEDMKKLCEMCEVSDAVSNVESLLTFEVCVYAGYSLSVGMPRARCFAGGSDGNGVLSSSSSLNTCANQSLTMVFANPYKGVTHLGLLTVCFLCVHAG